MVCATACVRACLRMCCADSTTVENKVSFIGAWRVEFDER